MSSYDDDITRLQALLEIEQEQSESRVKGLTVIIEDLQKKNRDLELAKRLSAMKLLAQDTRPSVPINSSYLALQAEVVQLRQDNADLRRENADLRRDNAAKDEEMSDLPALLENCQAQLTATEQGFSALNKSYHETTEDLSRLVQDIDSRLKARTAFKKLQSRPISPVVDTAAIPPQPSSSAPNPEKVTADTAAGSSQPSSAVSKSEKSTTDTAAGPLQPSQSASKLEKAATTTGSASKTSSAPDYAKALNTPAVKQPRLPKGRMPLVQNPLFAQPPVRRAEQDVKREAADQTRPEPEKRQISQKSNKASMRGGSTQSKAARGRGNAGPNRGSEPTQATVSGSLGNRVESRDKNVTAGNDQPPKKPEVQSSFTTPVTQANPSAAPNARRRRKVKLTEDELSSYEFFGYPIPSEDATDDEEEAQSKAVAPPVPATPQSPAPKVAEDEPQSLPSITHSHSGVGLSGTAIGDIKPAQSCRVQPATPLEMMKPDRSVQPPETNNSGITKSPAAQTSQEPSSNVRKRMADEGQIGTSASSKRLRGS